MAAAAMCSVCEEIGVPLGVPCGGFLGVASSDVDGGAPSSSAGVSSFGRLPLPGRGKLVSRLLLCRGRLTRRRWSVGGHGRGASFLDRSAPRIVRTDARADTPRRSEHVWPWRSTAWSLVQPCNGCTSLIGESRRSMSSRFEQPRPI
jgi:hypothetical protein